MTITNKIGVVFLIVGCCLFIGLDWLGPVAIFIGVALIVLGLFLAIYKRSINTNIDDSKGMGGRLYDDE